MNKLLKYFLGVFILGICFINTTQAGNTTITGHVQINNATLYAGNGFGYFPFPYKYGKFTGNCEISNFSGTMNYNSNAKVYMFTTKKDTYGNPPSIDIATFDTSYYTGNKTIEIVNNGYGDRNILYIGFNIGVTNTTSFSFDYTCSFSGANIGNDNCPTCPSCPSQYTSLECQTEYNLIPIEDVTANYCKLNFDLIEPTECPNIGEGTGEINRTARYINDVQYPGTASLKIDIADFLEYSTTYNSGETLVDVIGVDADEDYIEDVIAKTQMTPTAEDFGTMINGLQTFIPYVMIGLLLSFFIYVIRKFFR